MWCVTWYGNEDDRASIFLLFTFDQNACIVALIKLVIFTL